MLVLAVQIDQRSAEIAQRRAGCQRPVDGCAAAPLRGHFTSDDQLAALWRVEDGLDRCGVLAGADEIGRRASANQESDRADQDRLSSPRFPRQDVESGFEFQFEAVDDGEVSDGKETQHERRSKYNL